MFLVLDKAPGDYELWYMGRKHLKCQNGSSLKLLMNLGGRMPSLENLDFFLLCIEMFGICCDSDLHCRL